MSTANKGIGWAIAANLAAQGIRTIVAARDGEAFFLTPASVDLPAIEYIKQET